MKTRTEIYDKEQIMKDTIMNKGTLGKEDGEKRQKEKGKQTD